MATQLIMNRGAPSTKSEDLFKKMGFLKNLYRVRGVGWRIRVLGESHNSAMLARQAPHKISRRSSTSYPGRAATTTLAALLIVSSGLVAAAASRTTTAASDTQSRRRLDDEPECVDYNANASAAAGGYDCPALAANGLCDTYLCSTCDLAGLCDASCEYCDAASSACVDYDDDTIHLTGGYDCPTLAMYGYCESTFCPTCAYSAYCDAACGYCSITTSAPSGSPTTSTVPSLSPLPTPLPTPAAATRRANATSFSELKAVIEGAPPCGQERVEVWIATADGVAMNESDTSITLPAFSCVAVLGEAPDAQIMGNNRDRLFYGPGFVRGFELRGLQLSNGFATDGSGGVVGLPDGCGELVVADCAFTDNGAGEDGGALHLDGSGTTSSQEEETSSLRVARTRFVSNDCGGNGGAVSAANGVAVRLEDVTFTNNTAYFGGGLYVAHDSVVDADGVDLFNNTADDSGGGLDFRYDTTVRIRGGLARGNAALGSAGGGGTYSFGSGGAVNMSDVAADENFAAYAGGAISIAFDVISASFRNLTVRRNVAGVVGGALFLNDVLGNVELTDLTAVENFAGLGGGAIFLQFCDGAISISRIAATRNNAVDFGGAIALGDLSSLRLSDSRIHQSKVSGSVAYGGGGFVVGADMIILANVTMSECHSHLFGGGFFTHTVRTVSLWRTHFDRCSADALGAAAVTYDSRFVQLSDSTFHDCRAAVETGALSIEATSAEYTNANISNVVFSRNRAANRCGALSLFGAVAVLTSITAINNSALNGDGGAMCVGLNGRAASVSLINATISHNHAMAGVGGGIAILVDGSILSLSHSALEHNRAGSGGGVAVADDITATAVLHAGVVLRRNMADDNGGGISLGDGNAVLSVVGDVMMDANDASNGNGGALRLGAGASLDAFFDGCQGVTLNAVTSNGDWSSAPNYGLLVLAAVDGEGAALPSCCVDNHGVATKLSTQDIQTLTTSGAHSMTFCPRPGKYTASFSSPGGDNDDTFFANYRAVMLDAATSVDGEELFAQTSEPATFIVTDRGGTLSLNNNSAGADGGGLWIGAGAHAAIAGLAATGNRASRHGGGIHAYRGELAMLSGRLSANTAKRNGGAISLGLFGAATVNTSRIVGNIAGGDGGGIAATSYGRLIGADSALIDNEAGADGGGCALADMPDTISTMTNWTVAHNTARTGLGGGVCARDAGLTLDAGTRLVANRADAGSGGGLASVGQSDATATVTVLLEARDTAESCTTVEIQIDWLSTEGECKTFLDSANNLLTCESLAYPTSCAEIQGGFAEYEEWYRFNCTGCPCNSVFERADEWETFATIVDATTPWDGWSFLAAQDSDGKETYAKPFASGLVTETFCLPTGDYVFAALDKMTIPSRPSVVGGTLHFDSRRRGARARSARLDRRLCQFHDREQDNSSGTYRIHSERSAPRRRRGRVLGRGAAGGAGARDDSARRNQRGALRQRLGDGRRIARAGRDERRRHHSV